MSADWKAGDKALRIAYSPPLEELEAKYWNLPDGHPQKGTIYLVTGVHMEQWNDGSLDIAITIAGKRLMDSIYNRDVGFWHGNFRKIVPLCDQVAIEEHNHDLR